MDHVQKIADAMYSKNKTDLLHPERTCSYSIAHHRTLYTCCMYVQTNETKNEAVVHKEAHGKGQPSTTRSCQRRHNHTSVGLWALPGTRRPIPMRSCTW